MDDSKKIIIGFGLITAGLLVFGIRQHDRLMVLGGVGMGGISAMTWSGMQDSKKEELQRMRATLDQVCFEEKPFSAKFFAGLAKVEIATAETFLNQEVAANGVNSKDVNLDDGVVLYNFPISDLQRAELSALNAQREIELEAQRLAAARQKRKDELKALKLSELPPEFLENLSEEDHQLFLEAKSEQETDKAAATAAGVGAAAVGLAVLAIFLGGD